MKVVELMQREPLTIGPEATVGGIARVMTDGKTRQLIILESGRLVGVVTAADLVSKHAKLHFPTYFSLLGYSVPIEAARDEREIQKALATTARELMSEDLITVSPDSDVDDAATLMLERRVSCLPVVEDGNLVGLVDESDIVRLLMVEEAD